MMTMVTTTMVPTGFRFNPTDEEVIELLHRKASGQKMHLHDQFILEEGVYELDPQHLQWDHNVTLSNNERFYYCLRESDSREVLGQGWWKATSHLKKIYTNFNTQLLVGFKRPLTFHRFRDDGDIERRRKKAIKTKWIMHEYSLKSYPTEWRLCKIKYKGKPSAQEELENFRSASLQPAQNLQQISEADFPHSFGAENHQNQRYSSQVVNMYGNEPSNLAELDLQREGIENELQQQIAFYDPFYNHFDDDQLERFADSSEQLFPNIWAWHADQDGV